MPNTPTRDVPAGAHLSPTAACTELLPVSVPGMWSVRYTYVSGTRRVAVTERTGPIRPTMATDSVGKVESSPNKDWPGPAASGLAPQPIQGALQLGRLDVEMSITPIMAAMSRGAAQRGRAQHAAITQAQPRRPVVLAKMPPGQEYHGSYDNARGRT